MLPTPIQSAAQQTSDDNSVNQNRQQKGTGFTNISKILDANKGAGEKIGQTLGSNLAGQADSVRAGIQSSQDQFNNASGAAKTTANNSIQAGQQYVRQAGETDDAYANRLNAPTTDFSQVGKDLSSAQYKGPTGLTNADQLNSQAANVAALGRLAGTNEGQSQLLRSEVAQRGNYSQGQNALDSLLLGNSGQQYIQQGRTAANQVGQAANAAAGSAQAQAQAANTAVNNNRTSALQNLQNSLTGTGDTTSNGITGLETIATNNANKFGTDAARLQQLFSGKDANGNLLKPTDITDADKQLLQHASDYGVQNGQIYVDPNNSALTQSVLGNLASRFQTSNFGSNQLYTDPQKSAAINLAKILGDTQSQTDIGSNQFNKQIMPDDGSQQSILDQAASGVNSDMAANSGGYNSVNNWFNSNGINLTNGYFNPDSGSAQGYYKGNPLLASNEGKQYQQYLNDQTALKNNSTDVTSAVLKRLLGQG
jgi:hypothetical protein